MSARRRPRVRIAEARSGETGILERPPGPGAFDECPHCDRRHALELVRTERDEYQGEIRVYRCRWCGETTEFATSHPPGAL